MPQAAHTDVLPPVARKARGPRRIRFEVARSQLLVVTAALALLAMLFFLSGLAIGLLMHPRWAPSGPQTQTEVRAPVTPPRMAVRPPSQRGTWVAADDPPVDNFQRLEDDLSHDALLSNDLASIVWQPRRSLEPWERTVDVEASSTVPAASDASASDASSPPVAGQDMPPAARPATQVAQAEPVVDPIFEPRPGGLAQPPRRWRQSRPLAAAFLTAPEKTALEETSVPSAVDSELVDVEPQDLEPTRNAPTDNLPMDATEDLDAVAPSRWTDTDAGRDRDAQAEDTGWRPASSHWQSFYDDLWADDPSSAPVEPEVDAIDFSSSGPSSSSPSFSSGSESASDARQEPADDSDMETATPEGQSSDGWQPSSSLWQSFLDDPYDWTADRLPRAAVVQRSSSPRGSMQVPYGDLMDRAAGRHGISVALVAAMVRVESDFDPRAVSHRGARGLMQVMPATAQRFGVAADDLFDPAVNLDVGLRYLAWLEDRFDGDTERMLAAYNAGEAAVDTYDGVPPYGETQRYVERIYGLMGWSKTP